MAISHVTTNASTGTAGRFSRRQVVRAGAGGLAGTLLATAALRGGVAAQEATVTPGADIEAPPATPAATPGVAAWNAIEQQLAAAPQAALLAAELVQGAVRPIAAFHADERFGIGSSFKLYILGELARQVAAGQIAWEDPLTIEERYKSVPGGDLRYAPDGSVYTVRYFAERMIQKSDNTATDHLFFKLGRENIETMMATMGNSDPAKNIPLIDTRELAMLKLAYPKAKLDAYLAAPVAEQRQILANVIDKIPYSALQNLPDQTKPIELERVEWFATRNDLARAMLYLQTQAEKPGLLPVTEILSLETPLPFDGEVWPYVGYKGGSEVGLLSGTWLLHRADGRRFVLSLGFVNPDAGLDMNAAVAVMGAARDRLAETK